eukprot:3940927-Rhodomonas_salina.7
MQNGALTIITIKCHHHQLHRHHRLVSISFGGAEAELGSGGGETRAAAAAQPGRELQSAPHGACYSTLNPKPSGSALDPHP